MTLPESGADGLVPISTLPSDYYDHDAARHRLVGRRTGRVFALGDAVTAILVEADPIGGRLVFRLDDERLPRRRAGRPIGAGRAGDIAAGADGAQTLYQSVAAINIDRRDMRH